MGWTRSSCATCSATATSAPPAVTWRYRGGNASLAAWAVSSPTTTTIIRSASPTSGKTATTTNSGAPPGRPFGPGKELGPGGPRGEARPFGAGSLASALCRKGRRQAQGGLPETGCNRGIAQTEGWAGRGPRAWGSLHERAALRPIHSEAPGAKPLDRRQELDRGGRSKLEPGCKLWPGSRGQRHREQTTGKGSESYGRVSVRNRVGLGPLEAPSRPSSWPVRASPTQVPVGRFAVALVVSIPLRSASPRASRPTRPWFQLSPWPRLLKACR
jgi:hypothetical protein